MAKLTNCEISYERNMKLADYESKKFAARFSILIDDGDDAEAVAELYGRQIVRFVEDKLGIKSEINVGATKRAPAKEIAPPPASPAEPVQSGAASGLSADAAPSPAPKKPGRPKKEAAPAPADELPDETTATDTAVAGPVITDDALRQAIQRNVAQNIQDMQRPAAIRQLVQTFFPKQANKVWSSTELPQDKRQAFLDKMAMIGTDTTDI